MSKLQLSLNEIEDVVESSVKENIERKDAQNRWGKICFKVKFVDDTTRFGKVIQIADMTTNRWISRFFPHDLLDNPDQKDFLISCISSDVENLQYNVWLHNANLNDLKRVLFKSDYTLEGIAHNCFDIALGDEENIAVLRACISKRNANPDYHESWLDEALKKYIELLEKQS